VTPEPLVTTLGTGPLDGPEAAWCRVWWARTDQLDDRHMDLLSDSERSRLSRLRLAADRTRSALAAALLRLAAGATIDQDAAGIRVDRRCPGCGGEHGRPLLPGSGLSASVAHSGDWVAVALSPTGPVGVDVEQVHTIDASALADLVLSPGEAVSSSVELLVLWARKESALKATGDGLRTPMNEVRVAAADQPAALLAYPGLDASTAQMLDLASRPGHVAALTILQSQPVTVEELAADPLLALPGDFGAR